VPVSRAALMRAIELNGVQVDNNKAAFEWGRRCAHDYPAVSALFKTAQVIEFVRKPSLDEMITRRVEFLGAYQDADYAAQYRAYVAKVRAAEAGASAGSTRLTEAVARYLFKLMAYKDEYEVARLHLDHAMRAEIEAKWGGPVRLSWHLHPPILRALGLKKKIRLGAWFAPAFRALRAMKGLRGTALDVFGYAPVRRVERQLIDEYRGLIETVLAKLHPANHDVAVAIAELPDEIRGYEEIKLEAVKRFRDSAAQLISTLG